MNSEQVKTPHEDEGGIVARICEEADEQVRAILDKARAEADALVAQARRQAEQARGDAITGVEKETAQMRERLSSSLRLEENRIALGEKKKLAEAVLAAIREKGQAFRKDGSYPEFFEATVLEGISVVGGNTAVVLFSSRDEGILTDAFSRALEAACTNRFNRAIALTFKKDAFEDIGVVVQSPDGRISFNNRFSARLARVQDDIYMEIIREFQGMDGH